MKTTDILKKALEDKCIENIDLISLENPDTIKSLLNNNPNARYFSEWRIDMAGPRRYCYRPHEENIGGKVKKLFVKGIKSSLPKLTGVYSREELYALAYN